MRRLRCNTRQTALVASSAVWLLSGCATIFGLDEFTEGHEPGLDASTVGDAAVTSDDTDTDDGTPMPSEGGVTDDAPGPSPTSTIDAAPTAIIDAGSTPVDIDDGQPVDGPFEAGIDAGSTIVPPVDVDSGTGASIDGGEQPDGSTGSACSITCADATPYCLQGQCVECEPGATDCAGDVPRQCNLAGQWESQSECVASRCIDGECVEPSCHGLTQNCGPDGDEDCCTSQSITGGEFNRNEDPTHRVGMSDFELDRFEVSVGRFRKFLEALPAAAPQAGDGGYPRVPGSGWQADWTIGEPDTIALALACGGLPTWTDEPGPNENLPINCVNWYEAFAFCAWDGGYLMTEAQWNYVAAGGDEQRFYPWSEPPTSTFFTDAYMSYYCNAPASLDCFNDVGTKPLGDGVFGHADLAGNVEEWLMDDDDPNRLDCASGVNCLTSSDSGRKLLRGGSLATAAEWQARVTASPNAYSPTTRTEVSGFRCARPTADDAAIAAAQAECTPSELACDGDVRSQCDVSGHWVPLESCAYGCELGICLDCQGAQVGCDANVPLTCNAGHWEPQTACSGSTPVCDGGVCVATCVSRNDCGAAGNENCCQSLPVPAGTFDRLDDDLAPATVSAFKLDKFEVTVGRFREFVDAYPASRPGAGDGAHPNVAGTGWDAAWDAELPDSRQALIDAVTATGTGDCNTPKVITFTAEPGANETRAMNCVNWYEAFAFCAWSGGRLPTLAEHSYASVGGGQQRIYPWSDPADDKTIDATYATYGNNACLDYSTDYAPCISPVGSKPLGAGFWGHMDLAGNVGEFVMDTNLSTLAVPCNNCVGSDSNLTSKVLMGGAYSLGSTELQNDRVRSGLSRTKLGGIRCVYP